MAKKVIAFLPLILFALLGVAAALMLARGQEIHALQSPMVNRPVPAFRADAFGSDDLMGQVTVLNFFASWCIPCEVEHPSIMALSRNVRVFGVNYKDDAARREAYLKRLGNPYAKMADDRDGQVALSFGVSGVPTTLVIDKDGVIRYRLDMPVTEDTLRKEILPLIGRLE